MGLYSPATNSLNPPSKHPYSWTSRRIRARKLSAIDQGKEIRLVSTAASTQTAQSAPPARRWFHPRRRQLMRVFLSKALLMSVALTLFYFGFLAHYRLGLDLQNIRCLPWQVWVVDTADRHVTRGAYMEFRTDERVAAFFEPGSPFLKQAVGMPGDHVVVKEGVVLVNGNPLAELNLAQKTDRPLSSFDRDLIVPAHHYWMMGTHPYSYDSRYWGLVDQSQILGRGKPVW